MRSTSRPLGEEPAELSALKSSVVGDLIEPIDVTPTVC